MAAAKRRGLGKGLGALLDDNLKAAALKPGDDSPRPQIRGEEVQELRLDDLQPGRLQPRTEMDTEALEELADSIRAQGVVQPVVVRKLKSGKYEIVAGERRWRASRIAGMTSIPALVRELADRAVLAIGLIENIQREGLNPLDEAHALARLIEECGLTHEQCAEAVGRSRTAVSNLLRLLNLDEEVRDMLRAGELEMGHGRALLGLKDELQLRAAHKVTTDGLNVRQTEALVRRLNNPATPPKATAAEVSDRVAVQRDRLAERIHAKVQVAQQANGQGKLVIHFKSEDDLGAIFERLG